MSDEDDEVQRPSDDAAQAVEDDETGQSAIPESAEDDPEGEAKAEPKPKPKGGFQRRISELTARLREAERQLAENKAAADAPKPPEKPRREHFDDYEQYQEALVDWRVEQRLSDAERRRQQQQAQAEQQRQAQEIRSEYERKRLEALESDDDYEAMEEAVGTSIGQAVAQAIMLAENGPDIVRHLYTNAAELKKINSLPGSKAALAIGRLEERLLRDREARSRAPKPISSARTGRAQAPDPLSDKADIDAWMKARMKQKRAS